MNAKFYDLEVLLKTARNLARDIFYESPFNAYNPNVDQLMASRLVAQLDHLIESIRLQVLDPDPAGEVYLALPEGLEELRREFDKLNFGFNLRDYDHDLGQE